MEFVGILLVKWMDDSPASSIQIRQSDQEGVGRALVSRVAVPRGTVADDHGFKVEHGAAVMWKTQLFAEQGFRPSRRTRARAGGRRGRHTNGARARRANEKATA